MATRKKKFDWKEAARDIAVRSLKTGVQTLGAGFVTLVVTGDASGLKLALTSALAAALAVAWNAALAWSASKK